MSSLLDLISMVFLNIAKWALIRKEFHNLNVNDISLIWEARITCGFSKRDAH